MQYRIHSIAYQHLYLVINVLKQSKVFASFFAVFYEPIICEYL